MNLPARLSKWSHVVEPVARYFALDAALLYAVMDRETNGNNVVGDHGHGRGLLQIDDRAHPFATCEDDKGKSLALDPWMGVSYGARLLRQNLDAFAGDVVAAVAAYNCGVGRVRRALSSLPMGATMEQRFKAVDVLTTGGDYSRDVLRRRDSFSGEGRAAPST